MTVRPKDGREYTESLGRHLGHPRNMMTLDQVCDRFRIQASACMSPEKSEQAIALLADIENCGDISALGSFLY